LGCTRAALDVLTNYDWPGNVRELENAIERAVVLCKSAVIDVDDLPREVGGAPALSPNGSSRALTFEIGTPLADIEMRVIHETLRHTKGDKRLAAQLLGIATRTIYRKLETPSGAGDDGDASKDPEELADADNLAIEAPIAAIK
jgi:two-component system response regulator HydG